MFRWVHITRIGSSDLSSVALCHQTSTTRYSGGG